jgi:hypothetical protein
VIEFLEGYLPIPEIGLTFIYCNYKDRESQNVDHFIGIIVRQLVRQRSVLADEVRTLYEKHRNKETKLSSAEHLGLLESLAKGCSELYLIIDALDECSNKSGKSIWNSLLTKLKVAVPNLRLLYTSRDISDSGGSLKCSTCIKIRASDADIKAYLRTQVESNECLLGFCDDDPALQDDILEAVGSKAEGM